MGKVPDVEEAMNELTNAVETYWEKWESVRMDNKKTLMEADRTVNTTSVPVVSSGSVAVSSDFTRFNPAPDTRPGFLERDSSMLDLLSWIEQATYYVRTGLKNQPPLVGSHIRLALLVNATWLQSIESKGAKVESLEGIMTLIRLEAETRNPVHSRRIQLLKSALKKTGSHSDHL